MNTLPCGHPDHCLFGPWCMVCRWIEELGDPRETEKSAVNLIRNIKSALGRNLFLIAIEYYRPSGKFYTSAEFGLCCSPIASSGGCYMNDVVDYINRLRDAGLPAPGLRSAGLDFFARVDCDDGFPCLILPRTKR